MMKAVWYIAVTQAAVIAVLRVKTKKLGANADKIAVPKAMTGAILKTNWRP